MRNDICEKLNFKKNEHTIDILLSSYRSSDVIFLQEVGKSFVNAAQTSQLTATYNLHGPAALDTGERDQNSLILLKKDLFKDILEVTDEVLSELQDSVLQGKKSPVMAGDLVGYLATDVKTLTKYLFASFHGDTNGLATIPVVQAVVNYAKSKRPDYKIVFGMDANTYAVPEHDQQGVEQFAEFYRGLHLNTCKILLTHSPTHSLTHSLTHLLTHSLT